MKCEKCQNEHDGSYGSGRFCSSKCARSFASNNDQPKIKKVNCIICNKEIEVDKRASPKLCKCDDCRSYIKNTKKIIHCLNCNKILSKKHRKKFCNCQCKSDYDYNQYILKWKNNEFKNINYEIISRHIKKYIFQKYNNSCCECGWNKINKYTNKIPLEIEHIDGNPYNHHETNLTLLCPNCHSLTSTYKGANKGNGRYNRRKRYQNNKSF